jgi:hypothetical protein
MASCDLHFQVFNLMQGPEHAEHRINDVFSGKLGVYYLGRELLNKSGPRRSFHHPANTRFIWLFIDRF